MTTSRFKLCGLVVCLVVLSAATTALQHVGLAPGMAVARRGEGARRWRASEEPQSDEVFEAFDDPSAAAAPAAPGVKTDDDDENDAFKKARVLTYMGISLLPILALIPFMSARDFVPADPSQFT